MTDSDTGTFEQPARLIRPRWEAAIRGAKYLADSSAFAALSGAKYYFRLRVSRTMDNGGGEKRMEAIEARKANSTNMRASRRAS